jgi:hypothetical protein
MIRFQARPVMSIEFGDAIVLSIEAMPPDAQSGVE